MEGQSDSLVVDDKVMFLRLIGTKCATKSNNKKIVMDLARRFSETTRTIHVIYHSF